MEVMVIEDTVYRKMYNQLSQALSTRQHLSVMVQERAPA